jgi:hypothetical protein
VTRGHIRADSEVRLAIDEIVAALKPSAPAPAPSAKAAASTTPGKTGK